MGYKSGWKRKYITHYITLCFIIAALPLGACVPLGNKNVEIIENQRLEPYKGLLADGYIDTVILQTKQILEESETAPPADIALYILGEVYANPDFTGKDFVMSEYYFQKLKDNFPESPLTAEAKVYISFFQTIAAKEREAMVLKKDFRQKENLVPIGKKKIPSAVSNKIVENQNFTEAVKKNMQLLAKAGNKKPADEALYRLGLIFAHSENPEKDYNKSQIYLYLLIEQFPDSEFVEEAQVMMGLFETIEKIQQIDIDIEQQKKKLTR